LKALVAELSLKNLPLKKKSGCAGLRVGRSMRHAQAEKMEIVFALGSVIARELGA